MFARGRLWQRYPLGKAGEPAPKKATGCDEWTSGYLLTRESSLNSLSRRTTPGTSGSHPDDCRSLPWATPTTGWQRPQDPSPRWTRWIAPLRWDTEEIPLEKPRGAGSPLESAQRTSSRRKTGSALTPTKRPSPPVPHCPLCQSAGESTAPRPCPLADARLAESPGDRRPNLFPQGVHRKPTGNSVLSTPKVGFSTGCSIAIPGWR